MPNKGMKTRVAPERLGASKFHSRADPRVISQPQGPEGGLRVPSLLYGRHGGQGGASQISPSSFLPGSTPPGLASVGFPRVPLATWACARAGDKATADTVGRDLNWTIPPTWQPWAGTPTAQMGCQAQEVGSSPHHSPSCSSPEKRPPLETSQDPS